LQAAQPDSTRVPVIEKLKMPRVTKKLRVVSTEINASVGVEMDDADVIIGVGMGIGAPENLTVVRALADWLHAPIIATRRVVDAGWLPRQTQVGLTGRSIAPHLYIAIGISGKFNHVVGIQRAGTVVAINNNPDADIFKQCDYGIVGDWAQVVPALATALEQNKKKL